MNKYVAYYRVSTTKQGQSGLGLDAQQRTVVNFANGGVLVESFTEIESGKNNNRVELQKAIESCKKHNAVLLVAKLDRLSRNLTFISSLMDSNVSFVCCDMPTANEFTIHIFAALAQQERKMISERTKKALSELKEKHGTIHHKKGSVNNLTTDKQAKAVESIKEKASKNQNNIIARELAELYTAKGFTPAQILAIFQKKNIYTSKGGVFTQIVQIQRLLK